MSLARTLLLACCMAMAIGNASAQSRSPAQDDPCVSLQSRQFDDSLFSKWVDTPVPEHEYFQIALIMANGYAGLPTQQFGMTDLPNAEADARAFARLLVGKHYRVVCLLNLKAGEIVTATSKFSQVWDSVGHGQQGLIYFAGHGGTDVDSGQPFIVPIDLAIPVQSTLLGFDAGTHNTLHKLFLSDLESYLPSRDQDVPPPILIIDACRSPVGSSGDLQKQNLTPFDGPPLPSTNQPNYTLLFTTQSGAVAPDGLPDKKNGPFIDTLVNLLGKTRWDVVDPWLQDAVVAIRSTLPDTPPSDPVSHPSLDQLFWRLNTSDTNSDDYWYWELGRSAHAVHEAKRDQVDSAYEHACGDLKNQINALSGRISAPWAGDARSAFVSLARSLPSCSDPVWDAPAAAAAPPPVSLAMPPAQSAAIVKPSKALAAGIWTKALVARAAWNAPSTSPRLLRASFTATAWHWFKRRAKPRSSSPPTSWTTGQPVHARPGIATIELYAAASGGTAAPVSGEAFNTANFVVACGPADGCSPQRIKVISGTDNRESFVPATSVEPVRRTTMITPIDGPTGTLTYDDKQRVFEFFDTLAGGGKNIRLIHISVVPAPVDSPVDVPGASNGAIETARLLLMKGRDILSLPQEPDLAVSEPLTDPFHRAACAAVVRRGYCLMIEAAP